MKGYTQSTHFDPDLPSVRIPVPATPARNHRMLFALIVTDSHRLTGNLCADFPHFCDAVNKTAGNISSLYRLDALDWFILIIYFSILTVLSIYGAYRVRQVIEFWRYSKFPPHPKGRFDEAELPTVTIQLPLYNEMYVVERLVK